MAEPRIVCPKCGHRFPVTKALTAQVDAVLRKEYESQLKQEKRKVEAALRDTLEKETERIQRQALRQAKVRAREEVSDELVALRTEMSKRDRVIADMQRRESALARKESRLTSRENELQATIKKEVDAARRKASEETTKSIDAQYRDRELQYRKTEADLKKQLRDATRKLEQASQQTQGEVVELQLERLLASAFPADEIVSVPTGRSGADILQRVMSPSGKMSGTIIWESKKAKNWSPSWVTKLKADQRREKAEIAVLVSSVLPKDIPARFGQISGIWVTDLDLAQPLAMALRINLIEVSRLKASSEGKTEKMELLYQYLMSVEFRQRVEAILEAFATMMDDLEKERQSAQRQWAKRETQIRLAVDNLAGAIGNMQAIAPTFPKIRRLELPAPSSE